VFKNGVIINSYAADGRKVLSLYVTKVTDNYDPLILSTYDILYNGMMVYEKNDDGTPKVNGGSEAARADLIKILDDPNTVDVCVDERIDQSRVADGVGGRTIVLKPSDINANVAENVDNRTAGWGMTVLHEYLHTAVGGSYSDYPNDVKTGNPGPAESRCNEYRTQLNAKGGNWGQRQTYDKINMPMKAGVFTIFSPAFIPFNSNTNPKQTEGESFYVKWYTDGGSTSKLPKGASYQYVRTK